MQKVCELTQAPFTISEFEVEFCRKNEIPLPTLSPFVRLRNLLVFRNRSDLYHTKCALSEKSILSSVPPESDFKVVDIDVWNSDAWDPLELGRDYNFSKPFFKQFEELLRITPIPNLAVIKSTVENSDYTHGILGAKTCYLLFASSYNEDCLFSRNINHSKNLVNCNLAQNSEICYDCNNIQNGYNLKYCANSFHCSDSYFLYNCQSCSNCFGCVNLSNKQYHYYNQALKKEEYHQKLADLQLGSFNFIEQEKIKFDKFKESFPIKYLFGKSLVGCRGNFLANDKNCDQCYFVYDSENLEYCIWAKKAKSSLFHCMFGFNSELIYNSATVGDSAYNIKFCADTYEGVNNLEYCMYCQRGTSDCFGCVGLKKNSYCILNKQYSKEAYFDLVKRIKEQMRQAKEYGQFFPISLSPFYFNQSEANYFLPLPKAEVLKQGFKWKEDEVEKIAQKYQLADNISEVSDDILNQVLICSESGKKYKLIKPELEFYRKNNVPIPRVAPMERLKEKAKILKIEKLHPGNCAKCQLEFETAYDLKTNKIYCEECFQEEVS